MKRAVANPNPSCFLFYVARSPTSRPAALACERQRQDEHGTWAVVGPAAISAAVVGAAASRRHTNPGRGGGDVVHLHLLPRF
jgi:hypothetical protein